MVVCRIQSNDCVKDVVVAIAEMMLVLLVDAQDQGPGRIAR